METDRKSQLFVLSTQQTRDIDPMLGQRRSSTLGRCLVFADELHNIFIYI